MKILAKLLISFIGIALLGIIVGTVGIDQLDNTKQSILMLSEKAIPKLDYISTIDLSFRNIKVAIHSLANPMTSTSEGYYKKQLTLIEDARESYASARKSYEELDMTADEKALYDKVLDALSRAVTFDNNVLALIEKSRSLPEEERLPVTQEIFAMVSGEEGKALDDLLDRFQDLHKYCEAYYGVELPKETIQGVVQGRIILLIVEVLAFITAIVLGTIQGLAISGRIKKTAKVLDKIARGDLTELLEMKTSDEFKQVGASANSVVHNIQDLIGDTDTLVNSALDGQLSFRADPAKHQGDYRKVIEGINSTLDAVVNPLNVASTYIDRISRGDIPDHINETFNGDFNKIKDNLNIAIASIRAMVSDTLMLSEAAISGVLQTRADVSKHQGDYRKIIEGINTTLDLVIAPINETINVFKHLSEGDLTQRMLGDYRGDFDILKTSLNESLDAINDTLGQINNAVDQVAEGSVQVSQASQALSQGATEQASSLEEITSSTTEISSQTRQNTDNALKMNSLAREAQENAEKGNQQMKDLVSAMSDINESAEGIKKVVKTIDDISFQINLLALNANVEAARAGKYGKGFAVVAEEVRNLAVRSADSVKDTTRMVDEAINNIQRGNNLVDATAQQLDEIVEGSSQVSTIAEEVATAGREQTQGLEQISLGLNQIDQVTQSNTASAEESASASEELSSQAQQVKSMLARFKLKTSASKVNSAEVIAMLRNEISNRENAAAHSPAKQPAPTAAPAARKAPPAAGRRGPAISPAEIISLDDSNFGKF